MRSLRKLFSRPVRWLCGSFLAGLLIGYVGFCLGTRYGPVKLMPISVPGTNSVLGLDQKPRIPVSSDVDFNAFWTLWQMLKEKYYQQPVKDKNLFYGAMSGLAQSLDDPYTTFFEPAAATSFQESLSGKFEGIGAEIGMKNDHITVIAPLPETPAARADLRAGDVIVKIDKRDTVNMTVDEAVVFIRGPHGTKVTLTVYRPSKAKLPFDVELIREEIRVKSVHWKMLPEKIAYINVSHFNGDTQERFAEAVDGILKEGPKGLVLDLRNDPGGYLDIALSMAGEWVGSDVVVKERRQGQIVSELHGNGVAYLQGIPTVVLVNQGSASAAEIVAGALQDAGKAKLVGMKTYGKGSVQDYQNFSDGSGIKITVAEWLTPKERAINKLGLEPDIVVDLTQQDYDAKRDPQLDRAVRILNGTATSTASAATSTH